MAWNDGVSKELEEYFNNIGTFGDKAIEAVKEQIDIEVNKLVLQLESTTPRGATLGLLNSLRNSRITAKRNWYGYSVEFIGQDRKGVPYQKIANILNYGTSFIKGTRFITKAIHNLKNMDERIYERFQTKIKK
jgi:hypothetical protein